MIKRNFFLLSVCIVLFVQFLEGMEEKKDSWQTRRRYEAGIGQKYQEFMVDQCGCHPFIKFYGIPADIEKRGIALTLDIKDVLVRQEQVPDGFKEDDTTEFAYWLSRNGCERVILARMDEDRSILLSQVLGNSIHEVQKPGCWLLACLQSLCAGSKEK